MTPRRPSSSSPPSRGAAQGRDGLPPAERTFAVVAIALGTTMAVLDGSIANVALPTIARELRIDAAASIWIVNAYQLATTMSLIAFASLGDSIGYRPVYTGGLVAFTLGSLGCALSHSLLALALARGFQGFGGAALMSVGPALYRTIFPNRMLGTALGISAFVVASSAAAGPTLGGAILAVAPWPWLFIVNLPLGAFDALLAARALPKESGRGGRFDIPSALLAGPTLALLVIGLDGISRRLAPLAIAALLLASFVFGFAFVERQRRLPEPMLPLALFGNRRFSLAAATSLCSFGAQGIAYVALPFLFQSVDGYSPLDSGLLFTPWPIAIAFAAPFAGRLADRIAAPILATVGLGIFALGLVALATLPPHAQP
ncbi:MAG: MFS transporter, partial [Candidatus Dormibacteria bacterium]